VRSWPLMGGLTSIFSSAHQNVPLHDQSIIEIGYNPKSVIAPEDDIIPENYDARLINFQTILETGVIQSASHEDGSIHYEEDGEIWTSDTVYDEESNKVIYESSTEFRNEDGGPGHDDLDWGSQYVDWSADDPFTRSYETIRENTFARIEASPELQSLLTKNSWDMQDRETWERSVSEIISEEVDKIPGLDNYTNTVDDFAERAKNLNDLSINIADPDFAEQNYIYPEVECETLTLIEGSVIQRADNHFLPDEALPGDLKVSSNYFYATGKVSFFADNGDVGGHAFIVSSATTNIIEATNDPSESFESAYRVNDNPDYSFDDFVRGQPATFDRGSVYGGDNLNAFVAKGMQGYLSDEEIYDKIDPGRVQPDHPPEVHALAEIKKMMESHTIEAAGGDACSYLDSSIELRIQFSEAVSELTLTGGIYEVLNFIQEEGSAQGPDEPDQSIEEDNTITDPDQDVVCNAPFLVI